MKPHLRIRLTLEQLEPRTLLSSPPVFNVDLYGALGNGQADDTVAIRKAISAAENAGGGTIYFPAGTYLVAPQASDPVSDQQPIFPVSGSNLTFLGAGAGQSVIDGMCLGLTDPATHWRVTGEDYFKISRFGLFNITTSSATGPISNVTFNGLTMNGGAGYTGDSTVGGSPTTGDGWDLSHKAILLNGSKPIDNVSVANCTLCNWRGEIVYSGGNEIGRVFLTDDNIYGTNASAISCSANLTMTNVTVGGTSAGMDCYNGVENFAITTSQGTSVQNCTFECSSNPNDLHGNGLVYLGVPGASLVVDNSTFINNHFGILFSEVGYGVTVSNTLFQNNAQSTITSILGLYPQYPTGFGNFAFVNNTYNSSGAAFLSQFYGTNRSFNGLVFSGNTLTNGVLLEGGFNGPTWTGFVVRNTSLGTEAADVGTYNGTNVAVWSGTVRPASPSIYSYGDYVNDFKNETITPFGPTTDYTWLNYNITKGPQTVTLNPTMVGQYPVGFSTTVFSGSMDNWVLPVDPTWNTFTQPISVSAEGVTIVVDSNGKFMVAPLLITTTKVATYVTRNVAGYSQTISTSGGDSPATFAVTDGSLPTGLSLNASTGTITGTPTSAATFNFTIAATDSLGTTASQSYSTIVLPAAFVYHPANMVLSITGGQFNFTQATTADAGGTHTTYTFTMDGAVETFADTILSSVIVKGAGAGSVGILVTNDTYVGTDGKTHETVESVQSGPGGGTVYKFDANDNATAFLTLTGFSTGYAYVGRADSAQLRGVAGRGVENVFVTAGNYSYEFGGGEFHLISGAAAVYGYGVNSTDQDWQYSVAGGLDAFVASGNAFNYMSGNDINGKAFFNVAVGYQVSYGIAAHSNAIAYLIDSPGNDTFAGNLTVSYLYGTDGTGNAFNVAEAFAMVYAESIAGGTDYAYNFDTGHNVLNNRWILLT